MSAPNISSPWKKSVQQTALNPPKNVISSIASAKISIAVCELRDGKMAVNTDAPATYADATYIVKHTKKMIAQITCSVLLFAINLLPRYCGTVMASPATLESFLRRFATKIQLAAVPRPSPMPIHIWPNPKARMLPGSPIRSHADMSDACADMAATQGPIRLPPRKKLAWEASPFSLKKK